MPPTFLIYTRLAFHNNSILPLHNKKVCFFMPDAGYKFSRPKISRYFYKLCFLSVFTYMFSKAMIHTMQLSKS